MLLNLTSTATWWTHNAFANESWWRHQTETFSRNWPFVRGSTGDRWISLTRASDSELCCFLLNKLLIKQSKCRWFETESRSLWHHCCENSSINIWIRERQSWWHPSLADHASRILPATRFASVVYLFYLSISLSFWEVTWVRKKPPIMEPYCPIAWHSALSLLAAQLKSTKTMVTVNLAGALFACFLTVISLI